MMNTNKSVKLINLNTQTQFNPGKKIYNGSEREWVQLAHRRSACREVSADPSAHSQDFHSKCQLGFPIQIVALYFQVQNIYLYKVKPSEKCWN